jgi:hypothetical protein
LIEVNDVIRYFERFVIDSYLKYGYNSSSEVQAVFFRVHNFLQELKVDGVIRDE